MKPRRGPKSVAKLLLLPLYAASSVVSRLLPRTDRIWVFGRPGGIGDSPLAVLKYARSQDPQRSYVWLVDDPSRISEQEEVEGIRIVAKRSFLGYWYTQRARVAFITNGLGDLNRLGVPGAFVVYLTHGSTLKRTFLDAPARPLLPLALNNRVGELLYRRVQLITRRHYRLIVASSELTATFLATAYRVPLSRVAATGSPRTDYLLSLAEARQTARSSSEPRQVMYAPTWRDGADDPAIPSSSDWSALRSVLKAHGAFLCIRSHAWGGGDYTKNLHDDDHDSWLRFSSAKDEPDATRLLPDVDVLITDYSSIAADFSPLLRPIIFLTPDLAAYRTSRGLYGDYDEITGGTAVKSWQELTERLDLVLGDEAVRQRNIQVVRDIRTKYHAHLDGRSAERLYERVMQEARTSPTTHS